PAPPLPHSNPEGFRRREEVPVSDAAKRMPLWLALIAAGIVVLLVIFALSRRPGKPVTAADVQPMPTGPPLTQGEANPTQPGQPMTSAPGQPAKPQVATPNTKMPAEVRDYLEFVKQIELER